MTVRIKDLEVVEKSQEFYDNFNGFMISPDLKVFGKLLARAKMLELVKDVPGDIIECGVFKGSGIFSFLKLKRFICPNTGKKVIGFDFFDTNSLIKSLSNQDREAMKALFEQRGFSHEESFHKYLKDLIASCGFLDYEYDLVKGDISESFPEYLQTRPGMKISLLFIDLDLEDPTYDVLCHAWERVSKGGVVVFDEYGLHQWSEAKGADRFFKDKDVEIKSMNYIGSMAYIQKKEF